MKIWNLPNVCNFFQKTQNSNFVDESCGSLSISISLTSLNIFETPSNLIISKGSINRSTDGATRYFGSIWMSGYYHYCFFSTLPAMIIMMMVKKAIFDFAPNFLVHQGMGDDDCAWKTKGSSVNNVIGKTGA